MTRSALEKIAAGLSDVARFMDGASEGFDVHIPGDVDVKAIRRRLNLSQPKFAETFGFSVGRIRDWEQGRFAVDPSSRAFLTVIDREPEAVLRAIGPSPGKASSPKAPRRAAADRRTPPKRAADRTAVAKQ